MRNEEILEHAKALKEFCSSRENLDATCENCPFYFYDGTEGFCELNHELYPNEWNLTRNKMEWIFTYEDGTEIKRTETMSDDEMVKMYKKHGKVTISLKKRELPEYTAIDTDTKKVQDIVDTLEVYTLGRLNNAKVDITVAQLQKAINAIKALIEQQPCKDAADRQVVKEHMIKYGFHAPDMTVTEFVEDLPPVNQQPKTGRWVIVGNRTDRYMAVYKCSCCGREVIVPTELSIEELYDKYPYCHCGARMEIL